MPFIFSYPLNLDETIQWHLADPELMPLFDSCLQFFLDGFYGSCDDAERQAMLDPEPRLVAPVSDAYLAATAAHLANEWGLVAPSWTEAPCRFLPRPVYACRDGSAQIPFLHRESPPEFRRRNYMTEAIPLRRASRMGALRRREERLHIVE